MAVRTFGREPEGKGIAWHQVPLSIQLQPYERTISTPQFTHVHTHLHHPVILFSLSIINNQALASFKCSAVIRVRCNPIEYYHYASPNCLRSRIYWRESIFGTSTPPLRHRYLHISIVPYLHTLMPRSNRCFVITFSETTATSRDSFLKYTENLQPKKHRFPASFS